MFDKINDYRTISLDEIEAIKLMNRIDTKFIVASETMMRLLDELMDDYMVLEIASQRFGQYRSMYYDTDDLQMFYAHITGRLPRYKVRKRKYSQNGMQFLEVKHKKPNCKTLKKRLPLENEIGLNNSFVADNTPFRTKDLHQKLDSCFNRITLVNWERTERLTLDFNLQFHSFDGTVSPLFRHAAIVELKQDKRVESVIVRRLKDQNIRPCSVSKYCVGMLLLDNRLSYKMYKKNFVKFINLSSWNYSV